VHQKLRKLLAINAFFSEIEQQDTVDPELLRVSRLACTHFVILIHLQWSGLQILMRKVSQSPPTQIPGDDKLNFRSRAGAAAERHLWRVSREHVDDPRVWDQRLMLNKKWGGGESSLVKLHILWLFFSRCSSDYFIIAI
jgi:hypothetical protein